MARRIQLAATISDLDDALDSNGLPVPMLDADNNPIWLTRVTDWALGRKLDAPGTVRIGARFAEQFTMAVLAAFGAPSYHAPDKLYLLTVYRDGGTKPASYMLIEKVQVVASGPQKGLILDGKDISTGYERTLIDRATFDIQALKTVLAGKNLGVTTGGRDARGLIINHSYVTGLRAIQDSIPGRSDQAMHPFFQFQFVADSGLNPPIDADIDSDNILSGLRTILRAAAGRYDPRDKIPLGARGHFSVDVVNRTFRCGYLGNSPKVTFTNKRKYDETLDQGRYAVVNMEKFTFTISKELQKGQTQLRGGNTNHGLPDNAAFTGLVVLHTDRGASSVKWDTCAALVSVVTGNEGGGVFLYVGSNTFYRVSGVFDVYDLCQDKSAGDGAGAIYAACTDGVRQIPGNVTPDPYAKTPVNWTLVGGLTAQVDKLWISDIQLYALVTKSGSGANGVYMTPQADGEPDTTRAGYGGWTRIASGGNIVDAGGNYGHLYVVDSGKANILYRRDSGGLMVKIDTLSGNPVGIDDVSSDQFFSHTVVRTSDGNMYLDVSGVLQPLDPLGTLGDQFGRLIPTQVQVADPFSIGGYVFKHYALTERGFYGERDDGTGWYKLTAQSGVANLQASKLVVAPTQTIVGRLIQRAYAISGKSFYVSNTGGVWWFDLMNQPLDLGPFWYKLARQCGKVPMPDNDIGALGTIASEAKNIGPRGGGGGPVNTDSPKFNASGGAGSVIPIPSGNPRHLPDDFLWARRLTEHNDWTYRMVIAGNSAPFNGIQAADLSSVTADDTRGDVAAAEQLALDIFYITSEANHIATTITLEAPYSDAYAALGQLLPQDCVALDIRLTEALERAVETDAAVSYDVCNFTPADKWFVLTYDEVKDRSHLLATVTVGNIVALADFTFQEYVDAIANGQAQDRRYVKRK